MHGGSAPQVKAAAAERLAEMIDPALTELRRLIDQAEGETVRLAAVKEVLTRNGVGIDKAQLGDLTFTLRIDRGDGDGGTEP